MRSADPRSFCEGMKVELEVEFTVALLVTAYSDRHLAFVWSFVAAEADAGLSP